MMTGRFEEPQQRPAQRCSSALRPYYMLLLFGLFLLPATAELLAQPASAPAAAATDVPAGTAPDSLAPNSAAPNSTAPAAHAPASPQPAGKGQEAGAAVLGVPGASRPGFVGPLPQSTAGEEDAGLLPPPPEFPPAPLTLPEIVVSASEQGDALLGRSREQAPPPPPTVIKAILGFVALLVLAYLGGHPRVQKVERSLNITHLVTAGLPFVLLGVVAHNSRIGVLSDSVLREIAPLLPLGLGWIGFAVGFRFDQKLVNGLPAGAGTAVFLTTAVPLAAIVAGCGILFFSMNQSVTDTTFLRDALILGTAGAMTARSAPYFLEVMGAARERIQRMVRMVQLEQLSGVLGLMLLAAYFRPEDAMVGWHLPGTAWLFIALGIGTTMAVVVYVALSKASKGPQFTVVMLGSVCFTAGMASYLRLSPVAVCFIAGAILANFNAGWREQVRDVLDRLERPIYFLFLVIIGALWRGSEWQGWVLMAVFVASRLAGKWLGMVLLRRRQVCALNLDEQRSLVAAPIGALSVAIVVSAQDLYSNQTIAWMVTAVIGGTIATEIILRVAIRRATSFERANAALRDLRPTHEVQGRGRR